MIIHRRMQRILNAIIVLCLFGFVVIFLKAPNEEGRVQEGVPVVAKSEGWSPEEWRLLNIEVEKTKRKTETPDLSGWDFKSTDSNKPLTGMDIIQSVKYLNENFDILNIGKFGSIENVKTVLVIQVHNRPMYLQYLIESMRNTKGIEDTLLVFSHDINIASINEMIRNITFARVYQIFYPYNMQLFPSVYPGHSMFDCAEKMSRAEAEAVNCTNWRHPDKYGNYRVAQLTQIKHHWWWKMNFVFDGIVDKFQMNNPWVLLLEEDHMLAPDALHVLDIIVYNKPKFCPKCEILALGFYLKSTKKYGEDIQKLGVHPWYSSKHNMGMALQKDTWSKIRNCSDMFCKWDDYNWDWSLMQVSAKCLPSRLKVIFTKSPRVIHIGDCGVHTHRCESHHAFEATTQLFKQHSEVLFPASLTIADVSRRSLKPSKENGGWGDIRDQQLCKINQSPLLDVATLSSSVLRDALNIQVLESTTNINYTTNRHGF